MQKMMHHTHTHTHTHTRTGAVQGATDVDRALDHDNLTQDTIKTACSHLLSQVHAGSMLLSHTMELNQAVSDCMRVRMSKRVHDWMCA